MKKIFEFSLVIFLLVSCRVKNIPKTDYIFPLKVEQKLKENIEKKAKKTDCFVIFKNEKDYNELTLVETTNIDNESFGFNNVKNSNYRVLIDNKFYFLVFDTDLKYALKFCDNKNKNLDQRIKQQFKEDGYCIRKPPISIYHNIYIIKFDDKGNILE